MLRNAAIAALCCLSSQERINAAKMDILHYVETFRHMRQLTMVEINETIARIVKQVITIIIHRILILLLFLLSELIIITSLLSLCAPSLKVLVVKIEQLGTSG